MTTLSISLPERLRAFVDTQVAEGRYATPEAYIHQLIREDAKRRRREKVDGLLLEGLKSSELIPITPEYWDAKERQLTERHGKSDEE
jgi:antitoxin ParD1/3/4